MRNQPKLTILKLLTKLNTPLTVAEMAKALNVETSAIAPAANEMKKIGQLVVADPDGPSPKRYQLAEGVTLADYQAQLKQARGTAGRAARANSASGSTRAARATDVADDAETEADDQPQLDIAVWMSGEVTLMKGDIQLTLLPHEAQQAFDWLCERMESSARLAATNKFDAFLRDSRAETALAQTETKRVPIGAEWLATLPDREPTEPTEATGLPGVELDGPQGIHIPVFGQPPEAMTRAEQFAEAAARG